MWYPIFLTLAGILFYSTAYCEDDILFHKPLVHKSAVQAVYDQSPLVFEGVVAGQRYVWLHEDRFAMHPSFYWSNHSDGIWWTLLDNFLAGFVFLNHGAHRKALGLKVEKIFKGEAMVGEPFEADCILQLPPTRTPCSLLKYDEGTRVLVFAGVKPSGFIHIEKIVPNYSEYIKLTQ